MKTIVLRRHGGEWPDPGEALGARVERISVDPSEGDLELVFAPAEMRLRLPAPWFFQSCLLAVTSADLGADAGGDGAGETLVGLEGALLGAVESDDERCELVFDSIRVWVEDR